MSSGVDYRRVDHARRLDLLAEVRRRRAELDVTETQLLAAIATDTRPYPGESRPSDKDWVREDVACVLHVSSATARHKLEVATELMTRAGSQTFTQFTQSVHRAVLAADPRCAEEKHDANRAQRRVVFTPVEHGMVEQWALLPADGATALQSRVQALADSWKGLDDRTADQRRADALCSLAVGDATTQTPSTVNVTVALSTLLDLDEQPGELDGYGAVSASVVRRVAFERGATWRRLVVDHRGHIVDASAATYRPPAAMQRFVEARDRTCRYPGCRRKAVRCEIDHLRPWRAGGTTDPANLICLCSRHHHLKHEAGWTPRRDDDGAATWTNPTGQVFVRPPPEPPPY
ncbi:DUF222 domain-containing protein [uncultured Jatrophihabitans sp.]|uniref:HNH endonuclease signature motif containing protein n=1 Tax=uncultured Jatrophihabitans sp. TaxID=1610747 RepID=UPI0035CB1A7E